MAYILLALGALMSLVGLAAMVTGYPMIEIERGWATVITGAVLLSGGLVVFALGLVVRNLVGLRGALSVVGALPASAELPARQPVLSAPPMPAMAAAPAAFEMPAPTHALEAGPAIGVAVPTAVAALAAGAAHELSETRPAPDPHEPHSAEPHAAETLVPAAHALDLPEPEPIHFGSAGAPEDPEPAKSDGDWLDQAFSAFDHDATNDHRRLEAPGVAPPEPHPEADPARAASHELSLHELSSREPPFHEPSLHEPSHEPTIQDSSSHEAELAAPPPPAADVGHHDELEEPALPDAHADAPATAPAEPAPDLAVIGRYDSEGTSYVMYSDGSIEAQSEAGIYRFGSMAELKAFIES